MQIIQRRAHLPASTPDSDTVSSSGPVSKQMVNSSKSSTFVPNPNAVEFVPRARTPAVKAAETVKQILKDGVACDTISAVRHPSLDARPMPKHTNAERGVPPSALKTAGLSKLPVSTDVRASLLLSQEKLDEFTPLDPNHWFPDLVKSGFWAKNMLGLTHAPNRNVAASLPPGSSLQVESQVKSNHSKPAPGPLAPMASWSTSNTIAEAPPAPVKEIIYETLLPDLVSVAKQLHAQTSLDLKQLMAEEGSSSTLHENSAAKARWMAVLAKEEASLCASHQQLDAGHTALNAEPSCQGVFRELPQQQSDFTALMSSLRWVDVKVPSLQIQQQQQESSASVLPASLYTEAAQQPQQMPADPTLLQQLQEVSRRSAAAYSLRDNCCAGLLASADDIEAVEEELHRKQQQLHQLQAEVASLNGSGKTLEVQRQNCMGALLECTFDKEAACEQVQSQHQQIQHLQSEIGDLTKSLGDVTAALSAAQAQQVRVVLKTSTLEEEGMQQSLQEQSKQTQQLQSELRTVNSELQDARTALRALQAEQAKTRAALEDSRDENTRQALELVAAQQHTQQAQSSMHEFLQAQHAQHGEQLHLELQQQQQQRRQAAQVSAQLHSDTAALQKQAAAADAQASADRQTAAAALADVAAAEAKLQQLKAAHAALEARISISLGLATDPAEEGGSVKSPYELQQDLTDAGEPWGKSVRSACQLLRAELHQLQGQRDAARDIQLVAANSGLQHEVGSAAAQDQAWKAGLPAAFNWAEVEARQEHERLHVDCLQLEVYLSLLTEASSDMLDTFTGSSGDSSDAAAHADHVTVPSVGINSQQSNYVEPPPMTGRDEPIEQAEQQKPSPDVQQSAAASSLASAVQPQAASSLGVAGGQLQQAPAGVVQTVQLELISPAIIKTAPAEAVIVEAIDQQLESDVQADKASSPAQITDTLTEAVPPPKDDALTAVNKADSPDSHSPDIVATSKQAVTAEAAADAPFQPTVMELGRPLDMESQVITEASPVNTVGNLKTAVVATKANLLPLVTAAVDTANSGRHLAPSTSAIVAIEGHADSSKAASAAPVAPQVTTGPSKPEPAPAKAAALSKGPPVPATAATAVSKAVPARLSPSPAVRPNKASAGRSDPSPAVRPNKQQHTQNPEEASLVDSVIIVSGAVPAEKVDQAPPAAPFADIAGSDSHVPAAVSTMPIDKKGVSAKATVPPKAVAASSKHTSVPVTPAAASVKAATKPSRVSIPLRVPATSSKGASSTRHAVEFPSADVGIKPTPAKAASSNCGTAQGAAAPPQGDAAGYKHVVNASRAQQQAQAARARARLARPQGKPQGELQGKPQNKLQSKAPPAGPGHAVAASGPQINVWQQGQDDTLIRAARSSNAPQHHQQLHPSMPAQPAPTTQPAVGTAPASSPQASTPADDASFWLPHGMTQEQYQHMVEFGFEPQQITAAAYAAQLEQYAESQDAHVPTSKNQCTGKGWGPVLEAYKPLQQSWVLVHKDSWEAAVYSWPLIVVREYGWTHIVQVPGCGNCGYAALALELVVAIASEPADVQGAFRRHVRRLDGRVLGNEHIARMTTPSGAKRTSGCHFLLEWIELQAQQSSQQGLPSAALLSRCRVAAQLESITLWLRALAAHHMLTSTRKDYTDGCQLEWDRFDLSEIGLQGWLQDICRRCVVPMAAAGATGGMSDQTWANNCVLVALVRELRVDVTVGSYWPPHDDDSTSSGHCSIYTWQSEERARWSRANLQLAFCDKEGHFLAAWAV